MLSLILQIVALIGLPVGGFLHSAGIAATAVSVGFVGLAVERAGH